MTMASESVAESKMDCSDGEPRHTDDFAGLGVAPPLETRSGSQLLGEAPLWSRSARTRFLVLPTQGSCPKIVSPVVVTVRKMVLPFCCDRSRAARLGMWTLVTSVETGFDAVCV